MFFFLIIQYRDQTLEKFLDKMRLVQSTQLEYSRDYHCLRKYGAQSANRALGLLIAKMKTFVGLQYDAFTKLYESMVFPLISYGAAIWATQSYNCINAVQNRAARYFHNVGRYTPNAAVRISFGHQL